MPFIVVQIAGVPYLWKIGPILALGNNVNATRAHITRLVSPGALGVKRKQWSA